MEAIVEQMKAKFSSAMFNLPAVLNYKFGDTDLMDELCHVMVDLKLEYPEGVTKHEIKLMLTANSDGEYGIDYNTDDGDLGDINAENIMTQLYFSKIDWNIEV